MKKSLAFCLFILVALNCFAQQTNKTTITDEELVSIVEDSFSHAASRFRFDANVRAFLKLEGKEDVYEFGMMEGTVKITDGPYYLDKGNYIISMWEVGSVLFYEVLLGLADTSEAVYAFEVMFAAVSALTGSVGDDTGRGQPDKKSRMWFSPFELNTNDVKSLSNIGLEVVEDNAIILAFSAKRTN